MDGLGRLQCTPSFPGCTSYDGTVRLAKRLAELAACSRREAELYIAGGWVKVDGQVVEEPQFMVAQQKVELHPDAVLVPVEPVTILLHQPPVAADTGAPSVQQLIMCRYARTG